MEWGIQMLDKTYLAYGKSSRKVTKKNVDSNQYPLAFVDSVVFTLVEHFSKSVLHLVGPEPQISHMRHLFLLTHSARIYRYALCVSQILVNNITQFEKHYSLDETLKNVESLRAI